MTLTDRLPALDDPDALFDAFSEWAGERGISLYPAQQEALIEVVSGSNLILSTPSSTPSASGPASGGSACIRRSRRR